MANFDSYVKNVLGTLKVCGVPTMAMRGLCDPDKLFTGADRVTCITVWISRKY